MNPSQISSLDDLAGKAPDTQYFRVAEMAREPEDLPDDRGDGRATLIRMSPSLVESKDEGPRPRGLSFDVFRWKPTTRPCPDESPESRHPGGLFRVVRSIRFGDGLDERLKTFVVVEVFEGHQIIKTWKIGDLVHYVNDLGQMADAGGGRTFAKHPSARDSFQGQCRSPSGIQSPVAENNHTDGSGIVHHYHHHHHFYHHGSRRTKAAHGTAGRASTSQLMYRDLRQVFTDGSPVPSIESRRHCIVLCLPPLSCIVMADRVFLLVVQDMNMDGLIYRLEKLQLKHLGLLGKVQAEISGFGTAGNAVTTDATLTPDRSAAGQYPPSSPAPSDEFLLPFEIEALELLVSAAFEQLDTDVQNLESRFEELSPKVKYPNTKFGEDLHLLKSHVTMYQERVSQLDKAFEALISDPAGLMNMELSRMRPAIERKRGDQVPSPLPEEDQMLGIPNPDLEILLEFFDQEIDMFRQRLVRMDGQIDSLDFLVNLKLSLGRNAMIRWDVGSSMAGACMGLGTLLSGLFGMNVINGWEESHRAFWMICIVVAATTVSLLSMIGVVIRYTNL